MINIHIYNQSTNKQVLLFFFFINCQRLIWEMIITTIEIINVSFLSVFNNPILPEWVRVCVVIGCRCDWVSAGCSRELIGCSLEARSLRFSSPFLEALLYCPRLPACVIVEKLCLLIKPFKNVLLLVVLGGWEDGSLIFMLRQSFP